MRKTPLRFKSKIYKVGINACVDVPKNITDQLVPQKGYIKVQGDINGFNFFKNLVPVKNGPYRLFVNIPMLKGGNAEIGEVSEFQIMLDFNRHQESYSTSKMLIKKLKENILTERFNSLTESRRSEILKYLNNIKTEKTLERNIDKLIGKLERKEKNVRIP